ncbi:helix-turn-helix transcriptional regulator [Burkholderia sp. Ac-20379]|uniref:helix-turn-helix transcriptional regulator n=1 Tax=Burkholderia sp. Ac-20379 TaxID=2703900 RepID=UPI00197E217B|nr:AraC family transcriptional regulator [Burkholderia sp. Ac-20379]MBN3726166.1 helix-turn-helix transcriptional regulator [Burkholderia sp. Ac-20379]
MQTAPACHRPDALPGASSTGASAALPAASPAASREQGEAGATRAVQRALDFIDACFAEPISLTDLAEAAGLSVSRFAARFSTEIGVSPQQYVRIVRVRQAQRLLRRGVSPSVVAAEVGFFDQSHLCRHFKRVLGHTPREWLSAGAPAGKLPVS